MGASHKKVATPSTERFVLPTISSEPKLSGLKKESKKSSIVDVKSFWKSSLKKEINIEKESLDLGFTSYST
jgi:hypothetical protein